MKFRIDLKILFFLALFFFTKQLKIYGIIMSLALLHELAHTIVAKILNFKVTYFEIIPLGCHIDLVPNEFDYNRKILKSNMIELKYIFVALAGPILNLILAVFFYEINIKNVVNTDILVYSNILIFLINFIPIYPLDGSKIVKGLFYIIVGEKKGRKFIEILSNITIFLITFVGSIAILYLKNIAILIVLLYLWILYLKNKDL